MFYRTVSQQMLPEPNRCPNESRYVSSSDFPDIFVCQSKKVPATGFKQSHTALNNYQQLRLFRVCCVNHSGGFWCLRTYFHYYQWWESRRVSSPVYEPNHSRCQSLEKAAAAPIFIMFNFFSGDSCWGSECNQRRNVRNQAGAGGLTCWNTGE